MRRRGRAVPRLEHTESTDIIQDHWSNFRWTSPQDFRVSLSDLQSNLKQWSQRTFGKIPKEINRLRTELLQLEEFGAPDNRIQQLHHKLERLLAANNAYWQQRARSNCLASGDRNTTYFHHHASHHRRVNTIARIRNSHGSFVTHPDEISAVAVGFFQQLFSTVGELVGID